MICGASLELSLNDDYAGIHEEIIKSKTAENPSKEGLPVIPLLVYVVRIYIRKRASSFPEL